MRRRLIANTNKGFTPDNYLTIEALEDNLTVSFTNDVEYAIDSKEWIKLTANVVVGSAGAFVNDVQPLNISS